MFYQTKNNTSQPQYLSSKTLPDNMNFNEHQFKNMKTFQFREPKIYNKNISQTNEIFRR
jgi:hypothetical protein